MAKFVIECPSCGKYAEADLAVAIDQLRQAVNARDTRSVDRLSRKALNLLAERNRLCKLNK